MAAPTPDPESNSKRPRRLPSTPCSRFRFVDVTSPGAEGTINLFFDGDCIAWVNNKIIAAMIREYLSENIQGQATEGAQKHL
jgi:hypothetical protein